MALAEGTSEIITGSLTLHTRTAIWIAEALSGGARFEVTELDTGEPIPEPGTVGLLGIGLIGLFAQARRKRLF